MTNKDLMVWWSVILVSCNPELYPRGEVFSMTYKELLFKMASKGMLTLSNDKDGRGLFWAGMNNLEALEKEFNWG